MSAAAGPFSLEGKAALVTGASSGLGRHAALLLSAAGAKVGLAARRLEPLVELERQIEAKDGRAIPLRLDVTDPASVADCVSTAETELGPISILINNAGVADTKPAFEVSEEDWDRVVDTNLKGAWLVAQEVAQHMANLGHGGSIVNMASVLGLVAGQQVPAYVASKGGLIALTKALAAEWARHDIRVNALAPGYIETDINRGFLASEAGERLRRRIPLRRFGRPEDLDGALLLLASDSARYISGTVIVVDGAQSVTL